VRPKAWRAGTGRRLGKFSIYACRAIMKNYNRSLSNEKPRRDRFVTGHDEKVEAALETTAPTSTTASTPGSGCRRKLGPMSSGHA
jgi:hypothetical protein